MNTLTELEELRKSVAEIHTYAGIAYSNFAELQKETDMLIKEMERVRVKLEDMRSEAIRLDNALHAIVCFMKGLKNERNV